MRTPLLAALALAACATPTAVAPTATRPAAAADAGLATAPPPEDPHLWLEEVLSTKSLTWVKERNESATQALTAGEDFTKLKDRLRTVLDSKDDIPWVSKRGKFFYNFWTDAEHERGLWRRVPSLAEYRKARPSWETVLDIDELGRVEKENWTWHGASCLFPKYERCLVLLSRGGADAMVVREFDAVKKAFVAGGFTLPEAKTTIAWKDLDTVYVATNFGAGSLTESGYPRIVKEWKRGTPLTAATVLYEGQPKDIRVSAVREWNHGKIHDFVERRVTFEETEEFLLLDGTLTLIDVPKTAETSVWNEQLFITLHDDWTIGATTYPRGSCLTTPLADFLAGKRELVAIFTPAANRSFSGLTTLKSAMILNELEDVHNRMYLLTRAKNGTWQRAPLKTTELSSGYAWAVDDEESDDYWFSESGFTLPSSLFFTKFNKAPELLKQQPSFFEVKDLLVEQHFATSKDGTLVPYFQIGKKGAPLDGATPTLLTGYGGFEVSLEPSYNSITGIGWLEKGGTLVQANLRGGGEYGPAWHRAAQKGNRQRAYEDFAAIAEDLIARKVTSPKKLAIEGASNGGLLMGVMLTQRPELFAAVWAHAPLLDMKRYHKLLAGASWVSEYGDPDKAEEWEWLAKYSPYQNVKAGVAYPPALFTTSTRDDRVHPGHARKMVARMLEQGHSNVLFWENVEGGHGGAVTNEQTAFLEALGYTFLARQVGLP